MGGKPPSCRTSHPKGKQAAKWNRGGRTPKGEQPLSPPRAKPPSNIREAAVPEETRQVQDELNRRPANAATLNLNEAKSSKSKSLGDRQAGKLSASHGEEHPDDAVDRGASPKHLHKGSDHTNQEATSQHSDRQARKASPQC